jgi:hypothetical protein
MTHFFSLALGVLFTGTLLSSCSHSSPTTEAGLSASTVAAERSTGTKVDSLNGIPGHQFGEPFSAFPGLVLTPGQGAPGTKRYAYPASKPEAGWFGKHKKEVGYVFYTFRDDKFIAFQAVAFGPGRQALQQEAAFLFGQGERRGLGTHWPGTKAQAFYSLRNLPTGAAELLDVVSVEDADAQAASDAIRLKRENAGQ